MLHQPQQRFHIFVTDTSLLFIVVQCDCRHRIVQAQFEGAVSFIVTQRAMLLQSCTVFHHARYIWLQCSKPVGPCVTTAKCAQLSLPLDAPRHDRRHSGCMCSTEENALEDTSAGKFDRLRRHVMLVKAFFMALCDHRLAERYNRTQQEALPCVGSPGLQPHTQPAKATWHQPVWKPASSAPTQPCKASKAKRFSDPITHATNTAQPAQTRNQACSLDSLHICETTSPAASADRSQKPGIRFPGGQEEPPLAAVMQGMWGRGGCAGARGEANNRGKRPGGGEMCT